jgi:hypothetical protein
MNRRRTVAAAPVRTASEAWLRVVNLLADTLERSPSIPDGSVTAELAALDGLGPALVAGGHLESDGLVLVDTALHVTIVVLTADRALDVEENLNPVPGGATATEGWKVFVPSPKPLASAVAAAVAKSNHLSDDTAPDAPPEGGKAAGREGLLDLDALRGLRGRQ